jgi:hypothetical protein
MKPQSLMKEERVVQPPPEIKPRSPHALLSSRTVVSLMDLDEVMVLSRNTMQQLF